MENEPASTQYDHDDTERLNRLEERVEQKEQSLHFLASQLFNV